MKEKKNKIKELEKKIEELKKEAFLSNELKIIELEKTQKQLENEIIKEYIKQGIIPWGKIWRA